MINGFDRVGLVLRLITQNRVDLFMGLNISSAQALWYPLDHLYHPNPVCRLYLPPMVLRPEQKRKAVLRLPLGGLFQHLLVWTRCNLQHY